jgi:hypothetical protein
MADPAVAEPRDLAPDLVGVKSRVSWSAILAGTFVAISCYIVLTLLFAAIGISLTATDVRGETVGYGVLIAAILTIVVSLFLGGWVASQMTVGENHEEAAIYGILTWATVTAASLFMVGMGVRAGYFAAVGGSVIVQNNERVPPWEETARAAGVPEQRINDAKTTIDPAQARAAAENPENQEKARKAAIAAAWIALVGTMLSMAAAVGGALVGKGTSFRIFPVAVVRREERTRLIVPTA